MTMQEAVVAAAKGPRPRLAVTALSPHVPSPQGEPDARWLTVDEEPGAPGRARIRGWLTADTVQVLVDAVTRGVAVLDLSQLHRVDEPAVRVLAGLWPKRCTLLACARSLALRLTRARATESWSPRTGGP
jgi:hypothetical protein